MAPAELEAMIAAVDELETPAGDSSLGWGSPPGCWATLLWEGCELPAEALFMFPECCVFCFSASFIAAFAFFAFSRFIATSLREKFLCKIYVDSNV